MRAVTYHTGVGRYADLAARLKASCDRFGLPCDVSVQPDRGDWTASLAVKPRVVLSALLATRGPVLWLDADCELLAPFPTPPAGCDFGVHNWCADPENPDGLQPEPVPLVASGGVMYVDYTAPALELMTRWIDGMERFPGHIDDQLMSDVYTAARPPLSPWWMPRRLNWMTGLWGAPPPGCVVRHDYTAGRHRDG